MHRLSKRDARRVAIRAQRLDSPRPVDLTELLHHLTYLQVDLTAAVAPSAELVCWSRLGNRLHYGDLGENALADAGFSLDDVVRVRYLLPERADFEPCWPLLREAFARARPAATMQVCPLADPEMRIEIEATAYRPER